MTHIVILRIVLFTILFCQAINVSAQETWAQVRIPVACIRDGKGHATEMTSQSIMGTPLKVFERDGDWLRIQSPDGYEGYMNISSVALKTEDEMASWRNLPRLVSVSIPETKVYSSAKEKSPFNVVSELVLSSIVEGFFINDSVASVTLPDGRTGFADASFFLPAEDWASRKFDMDRAMMIAYSLKGTPYLWGACSTKSVDCSGLVRVAYFDGGILTLRDARQQIEIGRRIDASDTESLRRGDLLFFSNSPDGRISHVAIYDSDGKYIHSSGLVKTNHMNPDDPDFGPRFYRGASRIEGMEGTEGIVKIINHPWYFPIK